MVLFLSFRAEVGLVCPVSFAWRPALSLNIFSKVASASTSVAGGSKLFILKENL